MKARNLALAAALPMVAFASAARAENFSGPRIEADIGWDQVRFDLDQVAMTGTEKKSGLGWGFSAGYDLPVGTSLVAGIDTGVTFSNADHSFTDGTSTWTNHPRRDLEVSGRLGARLGQNTLVYAKAGYTNFQLGQDAVTGATTSYTRTNLDGIRLGAGAEYALGKTAYLKAEYRYSNYQDGVSKNDVLTGIGLRF